MEEKYYSDWLEENGVCSSEFNSQKLKDEFVQECIKQGFKPVMDDVTTCLPE